MIERADRDAREDRIAPDRHGELIGPRDGGGTSPSRQMRNHAKPEKRAYPYRPEPIRAQRENDEGGEDQDIDDEDSCFNRSKPERCREARWLAMHATP